MKKHPAMRYEISVWNNFNGDHVRKLWNASEEERDQIEEQYADDPELDVTIDREWEADDDD